MDRFLKRKYDNSEDVGSSSSKCKTRKFNDEYLQYGFVVIESGGEQKGQCVEVGCNKVLANSSLAPAKLRRHQDAFHKDSKSKKLDYFKKKAHALFLQKNALKSSINPSTSILKASYKGALRIGICKKAFTIAKEFALPFTIDLCEEVASKAVVKKLKTIPLSNDTIQSRVMEMASDTEDQLLEKLKASLFYAVQLDESTDVSGKALLLVFVRYCEQEGFNEDILFCGELPTKTTSVEVMKCVENYFISKGLEWNKCVGICTDGAASMTGSKNGVVRKMKDKAVEAKWIHCFLHRENLATKHLPSCLQEVLSASIKTVNFIKKSDTKARCFKDLCESLDADHLRLLYHNEVRWLSKGRTLVRLVELKKQVFTFLINEGSELAKFFENDVFLARLAYLTDIFEELNALNLSMQGKQNSIFVMTDKIEAFKNRINFWKKKVSNGNFAMFHRFDEAHEKCIEFNFFEEIYNHLDLLSIKFQHYFPEDVRIGNLWILNPFMCDIASEEVNLPTDTENELLQLSEDSNLKLSFKGKELLDFWICAISEYPVLAKRAVKFLLPFTTTYLCESGFSHVTNIKTKQRNCMLTPTLSACLRLSLSKIQPRIDMLIAKRQVQVSH